MLSMFFFHVLLLVLFKPVCADELKTIYLKEGRNEITFTIHNDSGNDLKGITINIDENTLPSWLKVEYSQRGICLPRYSHGTDKINIKFDVMNATNFSSFDVPLFFVDEYGNRWNYTFKAQVNSTESMNLQFFNALYSNFPNPFNPSTTIKYSLSENRHTRLIIYNSLGQKVLTLIDGQQTVGFHTVQWNGCDDKGQKVASGVYIYQLISGKFIESKQMILVE